MNSFELLSSQLNPSETRNDCRSVDNGTTKMDVDLIRSRPITPYQNKNNDKTPVKTTGEVKKNLTKNNILVKTGAILSLMKVERDKKTGQLKNTSIFTAKKAKQVSKW